mmetsp:Transcript_98299/g.316773  ORF Transcript_98299/g.316773 Transcript_98299/m.316773 type:complete len:586 (-) Transcript_98299:611-2368(-)
MLLHDSCDERRLHLAAMQGLPHLQGLTDGGDQLLDDPLEADAAALGLEADPLVVQVPNLQPLPPPVLCAAGERGIDRAEVCEVVAPTGRPLEELLVEVVAHSLLGKDCYLRPGVVEVVVQDAEYDERLACSCCVVHQEPLKGAGRMHEEGCRFLMQAQPESCKRTGTATQPCSKNAAASVFVETILTRFHRRVLGPHIRHLQSTHRLPLEVQVLVHVPVLLHVLGVGVVRNSLLARQLLGRIEQSVVVIVGVTAPLLLDGRSTSRRCGLFASASLAIQASLLLSALRRRQLRLHRLRLRGSELQLRLRHGQCGNLLGFGPGLLQLGDCHHPAQHHGHIFLIDNRAFLTLILNIAILISLVPMAAAAALGAGGARRLTAAPGRSRRGWWKLGLPLRRLLRKFRLRLGRCLGLGTGLGGIRLGRCLGLGGFGFGGGLGRCLGRCLGLGGISLGLSLGLLGLGSASARGSRCRRTTFLLGDLPCALLNLLLRRHIPWAARAGTGDTAAEWTLDRGGGTGHGFPIRLRFSAALPSARRHPLQVRLPHMFRTQAAVHIDLPPAPHGIKRQELAEETVELWHRLQPNELRP